MDTDSTAAQEGQAAAQEASRQKRRSSSTNVDFDTALAPTCMVWMTAIGLGLIILVMFVWGLTNFAANF